MADVHEPEVRSYNMSQIRGKDTKPEIMVRKFLHSNCFRFRLHGKYLPGKPDLVLKKYNTVIFVHGCFWHAHEGCKYFVIPKTRTEWWKNKIYGNRAKDEDTKDNWKEQISKLLSNGLMESVDDKVAKRIKVVNEVPHLKAA